MCEPVWPCGTALDWSADGSRFESAWTPLSLQTLCGLGHCLLTLSLRINEAGKGITLLPILMQNHARGDSVALGLFSLSPPPPPRDLDPRRYLSEVKSA